MNAAQKNGVKLASLQATLQAHTEEDARRFDEMLSKLDEIASDVKSLVATRSFTRGAWKAVVIASGIAASITTMAIALLKGH